MEKPARSKKVDAFFNRFAFLKDFFNPREVESVLASPVIPEMVLDLHPQSSIREFGLQFPVPMWDRILILDQNGVCVVEVGVQSTERKWYKPFTWGSAPRFRETVREAMARCRLDRSHIGYIVLFERADYRLTLMWDGELCAA